jgi:hypothetical protein
MAMNQSEQPEEFRIKKVILLIIYLIVLIRLIITRSAISFA